MATQKVNRTIRLYNKALHILKERITHKVISEIGISLDLSLIQKDLLSRAYAMCWASVDLFIATLKAFMSKEHTPSSVAKKSVTLLHFVSEYFSFQGNDMGRSKLITASKHITDEYKILQQINYDIPEVVDEFVQHLENKVFPTASPATMSMLQYLITHLKRKYEGARNIATEWLAFSATFDKVDINSIEDVYIFVKQQGALPTLKD